MNFNNKVVLVTGAGSGMGQATAILFSKEGADVVIVDWNEDTANKTAEICKEFGKKVLVMKTDISKNEEAKNAIEKTIHEFGKIDVLVNNAGIFRKGKLLSGDIMDTYDEVLQVNLRSVVLMTSLATPHVIKTKGCIINLSSVVSKEVRLGIESPAYTISKSGVDSFTRLAALELASKGVRVNAINPGPVYTNIYKYADMECKFDQIQMPLGRVSDPSEIANLIIYLASDKAKSITGGTYLVDCGASAL